MPTFTLVRHGPTTFNDVGRLRGWMDPPLTDVGIRLAQELRVPDQPIYSSDLLRAQQTAEQLGPFEAVQALRPWNVGIYAGQPTEIVHPKLVAFQRSNLRVPFGERWSDFKARLLCFVQSIHHDAVFVTHFRCVKVLMSLHDESLLFNDDVKVASTVTVCL